MPLSAYEFGHHAEPIRCLLRAKTGPGPPQEVVESAAWYQVPPTTHRAMTAYTTICVTWRILPIRLQPVIALPRYLPEEPIDR